MDIFKLMSTFMEFCENNPDKSNPTASALYFYMLNLNNKLGWKDKFGVPTIHAMQVIGVSNYRTYKNAVDDLINWNFIMLITKATNQYSSSVFALVKNTKAQQKHIPKHSKSTVDIDIPINTINTIHNNTTVRVENFVKYINQVFGRNYRATDAIKKSFHQRVEIEKYTSDDLKKTIDNLKLSTHHIQSNFNYATPEFCLRVKTIEAYKHSPIIKTDSNAEPKPKPLSAEEKKFIDEFYQDRQN